MGTQYKEPKNNVERIDDIRSTINTIDEVVKGYLKILGINESREKTENYFVLYDYLKPHTEYGIKESNDFAYGIFVMHSIRNIYGHEERVAHSIDELEKQNPSMKEIDEIVASNDCHPFLQKNDSELKMNFKAIQHELEEIFKDKSILRLHNEHEYWFGRYKDFLQRYYDRQEMGE